MCQMSMKHPAMFDQNPPHNFDKIAKKLITTKTLSRLDLDPKCQGNSTNQKLKTWGTKNAHKKNLSRGALVIGVTPTRTPTAVKQYYRIYIYIKHNYRMSC